MEKSAECKFSFTFFRDGIWDIEAWHKSSTSRSASPAVDGKCVTFESGKKIELLDSTIELAPHRRSFCQGCHVQTPAEIESREKDGPMKRLGGKAGLGGDSKTSFYEGRDRLTGRAGLRRKTMEKSVLRENVRIVHVCRCMNITCSINCRVPNNFLPPFIAVLIFKPPIIKFQESENQEMNVLI